MTKVIYITYIAEMPEDWDDERIEDEITQFPDLFPFSKQNHPVGFVEWTDAE